MANSKHLIKLADSFCKLAQEEYFSSAVKQISANATSGLAATENLLFNMKYAKSVGLQILQAKFGEIMNLCRQASAQNVDPFLQSMGTIIGEVSFYTSRSNSGTGMDAATYVNDGGYGAPADYVNNITKIVEGIKQQAPKKLATSYI